MLKPHGRLLGAVLKPHGRLLGVPGLSLLVGYHFAMLKPHGRLFNSVVNPTVGYLINLHLRASIFIDRFQGFLSHLL
jgi:ABC-type anion transport system duplicated permease subunit